MVTFYLYYYFFRTPLAIELYKYYNRSTTLYDIKNVLRKKVVIRKLIILSTGKHNKTILKNPKVAEKFRNKNK